MTERIERARYYARLLPRRLWWSLRVMPPLPAARRRLAPAGDWDLRRTEPLSRDFGWDRGTPIDRRYIADFLSDHRQDIRGRVLEVGDARYTREFGAAVTQSDVVDINAANRRATIIGDLTQGGALPGAAFDCVLLVQVLMFIYDFRAAVRELYESLANGGVLLVTLAGIAQVCTDDTAEWGDQWRFTERSAKAIFEEAFGEGAVTVETYGNLPSTCAFLQGRAAEELSEELLARRDADYPLIIGVRAVRAGTT